MKSYQCLRCQLVVRVWPNSRKEYRWTDPKRLGEHEPCRRLGHEWRRMVPDWRKKA